MREVPQLICGEDLLPLLPHRGKLFLLSRVTAHNVAQNTITTEYDITQDCIFYDEELEGVPVWAGFEFMAQSIAALTSIRHIHLELPPPPPGVILSVSAFSSAQAVLPLGCVVQTKVHEDYRADDLSRYNCELTIKGNGASCGTGNTAGNGNANGTGNALGSENAPLATATMTVMSIPDMHAFFKREPRKTSVLP